MISLLHLTAFGPHADTEFAFPHPMGHTEIVGPSGAGKSLAIPAVRALLFGDALPSELIPDGTDKLTISLTVGKTGSVLTRTMTRRGSITRSLARGGTTETFNSDEAMRAKLGALAARPDLGRIIVEPMRWVPLLSKELGRPFRDLLLSAVPNRPSERDVVARLMAEKKLELLPSDPTTEAGATKAQTAANTKRDGAAAVLAHARARLDALPAAPPPPDTAKVEEARGVLAARDAWAAYGAASDARASRDARRAAIVARTEAPAPAAYDQEAAAKAERVFAAQDAWAKHDSARATWETKKAAREQALATRAEKQAKRTALGERPAVPPQQTLKSLEAQLASVEPLLGDLRKAVETAKASFTVAEADAKKLSGGSHDCPTCAQHWPEKAKAVAEAKVKADEARTKLTAEQERLAKNEASVQKVRDDIAAYNEAAKKAAQHDAMLQAIGTDPTVSELPAEPTAPSSTRPEANHIAWAEKTRREAAEAEGARKRWQADVAQAHAQLVALDGEDEGEEVAAEPSVTRPEASAIQAAEQVLRDLAAAEGAARRAAQEESSARAAVEKAEAEHAAALAEAIRIAALVIAVRQAPSAVLKEAVDALGDLGRVRILFPPKENERTPEIAVAVEDERGVVVPWELASDGLKVVADLDLRAALRRTAGLGALPLFVDRANLWSGAWPNVPGPVVFLRTETGDGVEVRAVIAGERAA